MQLTVERFWPVRLDQARRTTRRQVSTAAVAVGALALGLFGCASDNAPSATNSSAPGQAGASGSDGEFVLLDIDPCSLLTAAEMEAALGSPVARGGFGEDLPGRCTHSVGGDVGSGVVAVSVDDPLFCAGIERAIQAINDGAAESGVVVDVGGGGVVDADGGTIQFLVGGGCVGISASNSGIGLDQATMVSLAVTVASRIG